MNKVSRQLCLGALIATLVLTGSLPLRGQEACRDDYVCFEPKQAYMRGPEDIYRFVTENRKQLGLTGNEQFTCTRSTWVEVVDDGYPNFAYECDQTSVQGWRAKYLEARVDFWSEEEDVRSFYCRCVPEDRLLPAVAVDVEDARRAGITYVLSRFPHITNNDIAYLEGPELTVQPRRYEMEGSPFRLAWTLSYRLPSPYSPTDGRLELAFDATTGDVFFAWDKDTTLFVSGISLSAMDALQDRLGPPDRWNQEQFLEYQTATAFRYRGNSEAAFQRRRLESLAELDSGGTSRFILYFDRRLNTKEVAALADDYRLGVEGITYLFTRADGKRGVDVLEDVIRFGGSNAENLIQAIAARQQELLANEYVDHLGQVDQERVAQVLSSAEGIQVTEMVVSLQHERALALADRETGESLLAVVTLLERFPQAQPTRY